MNIRPEHVHALRSLGYTDSEAAFLYLVATHSGYFTQQQFLDFTQVQKGGMASRFTTKALRRKHARAAQGAYHTWVYNLYSRPLYAAIDREHLRNRRCYPMRSAFSSASPRTKPQRKVEPSSPEQVPHMVPLMVPPSVSPKRQWRHELHAAHRLESNAAKTVLWPGGDPVLPASLRAKTPAGSRGSLPATGRLRGLQNLPVCRVEEVQSELACSLETDPAENPMAIITRPPASIARRAVTIRMPEPFVQTLHDYARFLGSSLDHIVVEALKLVFKKDAEFKAWQIQQQNSPPLAAAPAEASLAVQPLFAQRKRDGHRATGEKSREG